VSWLGRLLPALAGVVAGYVLLVRGALAPDLGIGRRTRPLGPIRMDVAAPPETVFDVVSEPYHGKTPHAMADKLRVLERGSDLVLAAHFTKVSRGLTATTIETVRFERPERISFRLVRGPVPHLLETFRLRGGAGGTSFEYHGELGTDLWGPGQWWGERVARVWEGAVALSLNDIKAESERRAQRSSG
jgi:hypothetical protein